MALILPRVTVEGKSRCCKRSGRIGVGARPSRLLEVVLLQLRGGARPEHAPGDAAGEAGPGEGGERLLRWLAAGRFAGERAEPPPPGKGDGGLELEVGGEVLEPRGGGRGQLPVDAARGQVLGDAAGRLALLGEAPGAGLGIGPVVEEAQPLELVEQRLDGVTDRRRRQVEGGGIAERAAGEDVAEMRPARGEALELLRPRSSPAAQPANRQTGRPLMPGTRSAKRPPAWGWRSSVPGVGAAPMVVT